MQNLLEFILVQIVKYPADVVIEEDEQRGSLIYTITVNPDDIGVVIGKSGRHIRAIRKIASIYAMKHDLKVRVEVADQV